MEDITATTASTPMTENEEIIQISPGDAPIKQQYVLNFVVGNSITNLQLRYLIRKRKREHIDEVSLPSHPLSLATHSIHMNRTKSVRTKTNITTTMKKMVMMMENAQQTTASVQRDK